MRAWTMLRRPADLDGSELIHAIYHGLYFAPHTHDTWTIGWVMRGANRFRRGRANFEAQAGTLCVVNPGEVHSGGGELMVYWNLLPSAELLRRAFPATLRERLLVAQPVIAAAGTVRAVRHMFETLAGSTDPLLRGQAVVAGLARLYATTPGLAAEDVRSDPQPRAVRRVSDYIESRLQARLTLAQLASVAGLSPFHFCRVFSDAMHLSPAAYVRSRRVECARRLIEDGADLADAALRSGFADQAHLTRVFRRVLGVTPAQWRS